MDMRLSTKLPPLKREKISLSAAYVANVLETMKAVRDKLPSR